MTLASVCVIVALGPSFVPSFFEANRGGRWQRETTDWHGSVAVYHVSHWVTGR